MTDETRIRSAINHIKTSAIVDQWAMEIAVEAMMAKIPTKPRYKAVDKYMMNHFIVVSFCPHCGKEVVAGDMHCIGCGQAIDWEK